MTTFHPCRIADLADELERLRHETARAQLKEAEAQRQLWSARDAMLEPDPADEAGAIYYPREGRP